MHLTLNQMKTELIEMMTPQHEEAYKVNFTTNGVLNHNTGNFMAFCHAYADHLLHVSSYNMYGIFIEEFNSIMNKEEIYNHSKYIQTKNFAYGFFGSNYDQLLIRDKRCKFNKHEFALESNLETELVTRLKDYYGNELKVKTQEKIGYGVADLLIDNKVAVELKRSNVKRKDVYQTFEYSFGEGIKELILIGSKFDAQVIEIAKKLGVACYKYDLFYEGDHATGYPSGFLLTKVFGSKNMMFDEIVHEIDGGHFYFSGYDPLFDFNESYKKYIGIFKNVCDQTTKTFELLKRDFLKSCELNGLDISNGIEGVFEQLEAKSKGA